ncbi:MAG: PrsW family intramembrane metalloprotease [Chloroflexota bacterium]
MVTIIIATIIPFALLFLIYRLDLYASGSFQLVIISFIWGGLSVSIALFIANQLLFNVESINLTAYSNTGAPIIEELLKAVLLIVFVYQARLTYFVDGAIYGFAIGIGFAIIENTIYLSNSPELVTAMGRVFSTNLMHATATGLVGITLGYAQFDRFSGRIFWLILGLLLAIVIHAGFNNLVSMLNGRFIFVYATASGLVGLAFIIFMIKRGLAEQKRWIEESLAVSNRITEGETAVVQRLDHVYDILTPLAVQFGPQKAQKIEAFLMLQARLGILQKSSQNIKDEKMRRGVETQIETLLQEIDAARRLVGPYCMIYLRSVFPTHTSPLWHQLEQKINHHQKKPSGVNIWKTLAERTDSASG